MLTGNVVRARLRLFTFGIRACPAQRYGGYFLFVRQIVLCLFEKLSKTWGWVALCLYLFRSLNLSTLQRLQWFSGTLFIEMDFLIDHNGISSRLWGYVDDDDRSFVCRKKPLASMNRRRRRLRSNKFQCKHGHWANVFGQRTVASYLDSLFPAVHPFHCVLASIDLGCCIARDAPNGEKML